MMKSLTLRELKSPLILEDRDDLEPAPGEVVVQLRAAALNRRDYWITQGLYPGIKPPVVLGSDGVGTVKKIGGELGNYWRGRDVLINPAMDWGSDPSFQSDQFHILGLPRDGTFATEVAVPASQLHPKPTHLSWEEAAALPLAGMTAYRAVFSQGGLQSGETLLVTGIGGGVATYALQFGLAAGAEVWVTSSSEEKLERARQLGAAGGVNYQEDAWWKSLPKAPQLVVDGAAGSGYKSLINLVAPGGRIVNYGATAGAPEQLDMFKVFWKQIRIQGTTMGSPADFAAMLSFVEQHGIRPMVDRVDPLAEGDQALRRMKSSPQFGKTVLVME